MRFIPTTTRQTLRLCDSTYYRIQYYSITLELEAPDDIGLGVAL